MPSNSADRVAYQNAALPLDARLADLVSRMTLEEKVSQMVFDAPAIDRLGIHKHNWWNEALHGVGRAGVATVFPQAIGLAATWNIDLMHRVATAISDEARAKHHYAARLGIRAIYTGLTYWSPNINIFRDPRWGRGQETYGEDPHLTTRLGVAFITGLQGDDPTYLKLVATPKHYAVHSGPEASRHYFDAEVSDRDLWDTYLPAFEGCIKEAKAVSIMGAYNRTNGEPCCASPTLLEQILRQQWGFDGYVVSDCGAIYDIYAHHRVVQSGAEASALAVKNGCELECGAVYPALIEAVEQGLIDEATIDRAVTRLFSARFRLGMFDPDEQVPYAQIPVEVVDSAKHRALALQMARESIVLLKNEANTLPLSKDLKSIAVIGPNADSLVTLWGNYNGTPAQAVTPLEGIRRKISPSTTLYYARGCFLADGVPSLDAIPFAYLRPSNADGPERGLRGAYYRNADFEGEPAMTRLDGMINFLWKGTNPFDGTWGDPFAIRWTGYLVPPVSGTYHLGADGFSTFRLSLDGDLIVEYTDIHHARVKTKAVDLEAGRLYRIQLDYVNKGLDPQIQLLWARPDLNEQAEALEVARKADVVIAVMGLSPNLEGEEMPIKIEGFAGGDRTDIKLPQPQEELLKQLQATGTPVVLVLMNGSALAINWAAANLPAIVEAWYPGQSGGEALAEILFGEVNPSGKLPVTFYQSIDDLPPFDDYTMAGRTYRYFEGKPLYPFGHGLSYTTFTFDNLRLDHSTIKTGQSVSVSLDVTNSGERAGDEVVQLYLSHRQAAVPRPIKELKGFQRISLQPGESRTVTFRLGTKELGYSNEALEFAMQPGLVEIMVGSSSANLPLSGSLEITA